jgi:hypothetical protein
MEHQPDPGRITDPYGRHREISKPPGTASRNYALSLMAQVIPHPSAEGPAGSPANLTAQRKNGWPPRATHS